MRIARLELLAYGPFTDQTLDFGDAACGTALVYGPNEAGKSAALRAIFAWLFGFEHRTADDFRHVKKKLLVGGSITRDNGERLGFLRRKANKNSLLNPNADNQPYPDSVLSPFLKGIDRTRFEQIYGIDHGELKAGGEALQRFKGLAGESLFVAGMGITGLNRVLEELKKEADALYQKDGRAKTKIRFAVAAQKEANKQKRAAECSPATWERLSRELRKATESHAAVANRLAEKRVRQAHLERTLSMMEELGGRGELERELEAYKEVSVIPDEYDIEMRQTAEHNLDRATRQLFAKQRQLESDDGPRAELARLEIPEDLLGQAELIEDLQTRLGEYRGFSVDIPKRTAELRTSRDEMDRIARDLGFSVEDGSLADARLTAEREAFIDNLVQQRQSIDSELASGEKSRRTKKQKLKKIRQELADAAPDRDTDALRRAIKAAQKVGDLDRQLTDSANELAELDQDLKTKHVALGYWRGEPREIETLDIPLRSTIERFLDELRRLTDEKERAAQSERECVDNIEEATAKIEEITSVHDVPTNQSLHEARRHRERGWELVRGAWLEGKEREHEVAEYCPEGSLALAYEDAVKNADQISDRLRREAESVAEILQLRTRITEENKKLERVGQSRQRSAEREQHLEERWRELWSATGVPDPGTPLEMREWLARFDELKLAAEKARHSHHQKAAVESELAGHVGSLAVELEALGEPRPKERETFDSLIERCATIVETAAKQRLLRHKLEDRKDQLEDDLIDLQTSLDTEEEQLVNWEKKWAEAAGALGAQPQLSTVEAKARMIQLREIDTHLRKAEDLERRIQAMQEQAEIFETDVRNVVEHCARDLAGKPPAEAVGVLSARLKQTREDQTRGEELTKQLAQLSDEIDSWKAEQEEARATLTGLCALAGVQAPEELKDAEQRSEQKRRAQEKLKELDARLLKIGRGASVETLIEEAAGMDGNSVEAELKEIEDEITSLEAERDELAGKARDCENACEAVDGSAAASEADERSLALLGRIRDHADRYVRLRLAAALLGQRIEKHRAETQDPMLVRASVLFSELTCGSFSGLVADYDKDDRPIIAGRRASSGDIVPLAGFSDGTSDQLYLALRLAYLRRIDAEGELMPLIVDDILVDFDEPRAAAALRILGELSRERQVILFTHHEHILKLARENIPPDLLVEVELRAP